MRSGHVGRRGIILLRRAVRSAPRRPPAKVDRTRGLVKVAMEGACCQPLTRRELARVVTDPIQCTAS
jgi:hypothetical protein